MKNIYLVILLFFAGCENKNAKIASLTSRIDSLQKVINNSYSPGLGEFMTTIQLHHAKLWFAGKAGNWDLANFEIKEIVETLDDIKKHNSDREEIKSLPMIEPALDSINSAIQRKNLQGFKSSFQLLTNTCNSCHIATKHGFNVIKIPKNEPVVNQKF